MTATGNAALRILLIEPPFYRLYGGNYSLDKYPLSLAYLSEYLLARGQYEIMIYNADFSPRSSEMKIEYLAGEGFGKYKENLMDDGFLAWTELKSVISGYAPDIVGITAKSQNFRSALKVAGIVKETNKDIQVVLGGPHPSIAGEKVLDDANIDFVVSGEGEVTFYELVNEIGSEKNFSQIPGLSFREYGNVVTNTARKFIDDLADLPNPYLHVKSLLKDFDQYPIHSFRSIFATRGCPFSCSFCGSHAVWSRKVRFRPVSGVIEEIKFLRSLGVRYFNFDDDTFGVTKKYLISLCHAIKKEFRGLTWSCEIHVKLIDDEVLNVMKDSGCDLIKIGIESGNNQILKEIGKNITIEEAISAAAKITASGIHVMTFFMVGFPQETEDSIIDTLHAMKKIEGYTTYSIFTPYRGTRAFEQCVEMGIIPDGFDVSYYNHQSPDNNFSKNIPHEKFRDFASEIEKLVDAKNSEYSRKVRIRRYRPSRIWQKLFG